MGTAGGTVLITGGLGYVGGRIATYLATSAPHLSLRLMTRRTWDNVPQWAKKMDVVQADLLENNRLEAALDGVETVIHLAAVNEIESQRDPNLALEVNGKGTYLLLTACQARGVKRFIYFSTFHVYGPGATQPITESTPTRPIHPYAITHRLAEDYVNWFRHSFGMETLVLRLSNAYGYPADHWVQRWTLVFNDLCMQAVQNGEIRLRSQGTQQRDFVTLNDVARGLHHLLSLSTDEWSDGLFNFGGDCSLSILQLAQRVASDYFNCYGKEVSISTGEAEDTQGAGPVIYCIDKLKRTRFSLVGNMSSEVRGTFEVCEQLAHQIK